MEHPGLGEEHGKVNKSLLGEDGDVYLTPPTSTKFVQHRSQQHEAEMSKLQTAPPVREDSQVNAEGNLSDSPRYVDTRSGPVRQNTGVIPPDPDILDREPEYTEVDESPVSNKGRPLPDPKDNGNDHQVSHNSRQESHGAVHDAHGAPQGGSRRIMIVLVFIIVILLGIILAGGGYLGWRLRHISRNCAIPTHQTVSLCDDDKCSSACSSPSCTNCCGTAASASIVTVRVGDNTIQAPLTGDEWLVFMKRQDGNVDFISPGWQRYKDGFGNLKGEFWLGNELLHRLTTNGSQWRLRVDMKAFSGECRYAEYDNFWIGPESDFYRMHLSNYSGNAGDGLTGTNEPWHNHNDMYFSTYDADHDAANDTNCARKMLGGWWYNECFYAKFTGIYGEQVGQYSGVAWEIWLGEKTFLEYADMKISVN